MQKNVLANSSSPYLQQHANNPVHWQEWTPEVLQYARENNKPLIVSIGYAACHWCHVMEHESFMDTLVANIMNKNFVCIKVDREERPDVDQVYMNAVHLLSGRGGWPLNAFALPDGRPFYAGTYFPKEQWIHLLEQIAQVYKNEYAKVESQAEALTNGIKAQEVVQLASTETEPLTETDYTRMAMNLHASVDNKLGGFKGAPKFPLAVGWEFLLQYYYLSGDENSLAAVRTTLDEMGRGGIYDQIGGGFARYSVDDKWKVPHFEKMLYDNGQLVSLYANAYKITQSPFYKRIIEETLEFTEREMLDESGGFYSSLNADSGGEEGKFYVWTEEQINSVLKEDTAKRIIEYYEIASGGNWEHGNNILYARTSDEDFAAKNNLSEEEWLAMLKEAKKKLLAERAKRIRPSTDDKILTAWNAIMLKGYIDAYHALSNENYLDRALTNARFLEKNMMQKDGRLFRNYKDGKASIAAFLDDYALLADACIALYQASLDPYWLELSCKLVDYCLEHFSDPESPMFFYTSDQSTGLIARSMELSDNVIPASNSVMAHALFILGEFYYSETYIERSQAMLRQVQADMLNGGPYYANWGLLAGIVLAKPHEIAILGNNALGFAHEMQRNFLPTSFFMGGKTEHLPLLENKKVEGETYIYVCRDKSCQLPVRDVGTALKQVMASEQE